jgi:hypothetical protein
MRTPLFLFFFDIKKCSCQGGYDRIKQEVSPSPGKKGRQEHCWLYGPQETTTNCLCMPCMAKALLVMEKSEAKREHRKKTRN